MATQRAGLVTVASYGDAMAKKQENHLFEISAKSYYRGNDAIDVKAMLTWELTDQHAHDVQIPDVRIDAAYTDFPCDDASIIVISRIARQLGHALLDLADKADEWETRLEEN